MPVEIDGRQYVSLFDILSVSSRIWGNRVAVRSQEGKFTYSYLLDQVERLSGFLSSLNIRPGDPVVLYLPNSLEMILAYFSVWRIGGVAVPVNYMWKEDEVKFVLKDVGAKVVLVSPEKFVSIEGLRSEVRNLHFVVDVSSVLDKINTVVIPPIARVKEHQCAVIIYTSGTTGRPKGAMLSHFNILSNISSCRDALTFSYRDRVPCLLPLFHSFALTVCLLTPFSVGAEVLLLDPRRGVKRMFQQMIKSRVTILVGIPALFSIMSEVKIPKWIPRFFLKLMLPIRVAISGSAPLPVEVLDKFMDKYGIPLLEGYGLTEASPVVSLNPIDAIRPGSVGIPIKGVEVKIVDDGGKECGVGRVGEIFVRGTNVMLGYYKRIVDTKAVLRNGWLYTGDLGYKDRDGYIYIVGRKKEMIIVRGLNVYPREIEDVVMKLPGVKECAVVGIKHKTKGEVPYAFVVLKKGWDLSTKEILAYLRSKLADYKVPQRVIILEELPKNSLRKVEKRKLISLVQSEVKEGG